MINLLYKYNLFNELITIIDKIIKKKYLKKNKTIYLKIKKILNNDKIITLDIGAAGGFNKEEVFSSKLNNFFKVYEVEPSEEEFLKLSKKNRKINVGFWSHNTKKTLYITKNSGATSLFYPDYNNFILIYKKYNSMNDIVKVIGEKIINCITIENYLNQTKCTNIDYIKIDTQGAEFNILKGLGNFRPLLIRLEVQTIQCYNGIKTFEKIISLLDDLGYVAIKYEKLDYSVLKIPIFMDLIFVPKYENYYESKIIKDRKNKFLALLNIFGLEKISSNYNL